DGKHNQSPFGFRYETINDSPGEETEDGTMSKSKDVKKDGKKKPGKSLKEKKEAKRLKKLGKA
ncbi:MAG: hypothetical protein PHF23_06725, partial [Smithellaceae bacterium]|nr:hypothetical protein [Smithellaceae bacterium]